MTADIQATPFKGMHGPRKLDIILIGSLQQKGMDSV
jgi:L-lactate utilization protein LutC